MARLRIERASEIARLAAALGSRGLELMAVCGEAAVTDLRRLLRPVRLERAPHAIKNVYFGGNVNVTGLICACDLLAQLPRELAGTFVLLPEVMFNHDGLTLDGDTCAHVEVEVAARGGIVACSVPAPSQMLAACLAALEC